MVPIQTHAPKVASVAQAPQLPPAQIKKGDKEKSPTTSKDQSISNELPQINLPIIEQTETLILGEILSEAPIQSQPQPVHQIQPQIAEVQIIQPDFQEPDVQILDFEPDSSRSQDIVIEHDVVEEQIIESPDILQATADLQTAETVEISEESAIVHEEDKNVWRPPTEQDKLGRNKEILMQLEKLMELKEKGVLTDAEFYKKKSELLK